MLGNSRLVPTETESRREGGLLARMASGDESALSELMDRMWAPLLGYAVRLLDNEDAAADVTQLAFVRLWEQRYRHVAENSIAAYLYRTVRNLAIDEQRRLRVRRDWARSRAAGSHATRITPLDDAQAGELSEGLSRALETLPPRRREVLELARFHNLSYRQIGEVMGISPQTVANQMSAALSQLRVELEPYLETAGAHSAGRLA